MLPSGAGRVSRAEHEVAPAARHPGCMADIELWAALRDRSALSPLHPPAMTACRPCCTAPLLLPPARLCDSLCLSAVIMVTYAGKHAVSDRKFPGDAGTRWDEMRRRAVVTCRRGHLWEALR